MKNAISFFEMKVGLTSVLVAALLTSTSCSMGHYPNMDDLEVTTVIYDLPANDALSVDTEGNVYASNFGQFVGSGGTGTTLLKVRPRTGDYDTLADNLVGPLGNAVDRNGNIYVNNGNDFVSADVLRISKNGGQNVLATVPGFPSGMAIDGNRNLYVTNFTAPTLHKVAPNGEVSVLATDDRLAGCVGIDFDGRGNLIAGNYLNGEIYLVRMDGSVEFIGAIPAVVSDFVMGYLTVLDGNIYATAIGEGIIYRVTLSGEVSVFAGNGTAESIDGPLLEASFNAPNGITADSRRKMLYVSEFGGTGALRAIRLR